MIIFVMLGVPLDGMAVVVLYTTPMIAKRITLMKKV